METFTTENVWRMSKCEEIQEPRSFAMKVTMDLAGYGNQLLRAICEERNNYENEKNQFEKMKKKTIRICKNYRRMIISESVRLCKNNHSYQNVFSSSLYPEAV